MYRLFIDTHTGQQSHSHMSDNLQASSPRGLPHDRDNHAVVAEAGVTPSPRKRCLTCRARKVKCDEIHPVCHRCRKYAVECCWADESPRQRLAAPPSIPSTSATSRLPACLACRYARSKCSKARPSCSQCQYSGRQCQYPEPPEGRSLSSTAEEWMKRLRRGASPHQEVPQINPPNETVLALPSPRPAQVQGLSRDRTGHNESGPETIQIDLPNSRVTEPIHNTSPITSIGLPDQDRIERLAVAFFRHVHVYRANAFLHRDHTIAAIRERTLSEAIVLALCATGARFTSPPESDDVAKEWAAKSGLGVMTATESSRETIATSLLLAIYTQQAGRFTQSHLWSTIAISQAVNLGLHREAPPGTRSFVHSERDRRLFFACYASNRLIANGTPESIQCPASRIKLRLPCDGFNFQMELSVETPESVLEGDDSNVPAWMYKNVGVMGFWVRLVGVRVMIKRYFHTLREIMAVVRESRSVPGVSTDIPKPWIPNSPFQACMAKLASLRETLPARLQLTRDRVVRRHSEPALGQVVMFYLWWNECHLELCSVALAGYPQSLTEEILSTAPNGWVEQARQSSLRHAQAIADILAMVARETPGEPQVIYDHTIAHVVYLSIRVQLELDTAGDTECTKLKDRVDIMLAFVERTSVYFHSVYLVLKELRRMLARHGLLFQSPLEPESRPETPPLPWFRRQKNLDINRLSEKATFEEANLDAILLELLPDCTAYGTTSWIRGHESNESMPSAPQHSCTATWDPLPDGWIAAPTSNPTATPWSAEAELSRFDPLLPEFTLPHLEDVSGAEAFVSSGPFPFGALES
ncbi:hypothetical protein BO71DRAFT_440979 [Aspergillus ellipticus CBS 707.79]|uniref:Zn(2)-C6 fungal-type domain-containing protein n=1 Tax=Aspergillus ellipticus CBS 707.79 TaxID=1448320 RepID=A0A319DT29_9EURO|nr:hypothetical protein BO71DRAFT_440979 [Aspergillus ellipticus CBS 707.79]